MSLYLGTMCAQYREVKGAERVTVTATESSDGLKLHIIVHIGESQSSEMHLAYQTLLSALQRMQDLMGIDASTSPSSTKH